MSYSPQYDPDDDAKPVGKLFTRQLSQRDLSFAIPVNFVEHAGISLTAACFAHRRYVGEEAQRCFSNLLAIGFHRYEIDVYWDASRQLWSLCPVELDGERQSPDNASSSASAASSSTDTTLATDLSMVAMSTPGAPAPTRRDEAVGPRQATATESTLNASNLSRDSTSSAAVDPDETSISTSSLTPTATAAAQDGSSDDNNYQQIGPYACSESVDVDWLSRIMWTYLDSTETNLNATLRYMIFNLHAAVPASDANGSAQAPSEDDLPDEGDTLGAVLASNLSSFLYTQNNLRHERANINNSWYDVPEGMDPTPGYYSVQDIRDTSSTLDGWPSENYVEMQKGKRLFLGFGSIDPQMESYNVSRDNETIFPQDYLHVTRQISIDSTGAVTSGCFYTPGEYSIGSVNNSWAFTSTSSTQPEILRSSSNITRCGVSSILNVTLQNVTADRNFLPYQNYLQSTIWSWAPDYPKIANASRPLPNTETASSATDDDDNNTSSEDDEPGRQARCAVLNATTGFWQNVLCDSEHYSACRDAGSIYNWSISAASTSYTKAGVSCRDGAAFDVPRTGLQNTYLLHTWRQYIADPASDYDANDEDDLLWLNFNNLDSELCWVVGQNSTCPYVNRRSGDRRVIVPVVAAVVVFALGVFTVFVKCAANRRMNKRQRRRRRGDDGWDYEGVPS